MKKRQESDHPKEGIRFLPFIGQTEKAEKTAVYTTKAHSGIVSSRQGLGKPGLWLVAYAKKDIRMTAADALFSFILY